MRHRSCSVIAMIRKPFFCSKVRKKSFDFSCQLQNSKSGNSSDGPRRQQRGRRRRRRPTTLQTTYLIFVGFLLSHGSVIRKLDRQPGTLIAEAATEALKLKLKKSWPSKHFFLSSKLAGSDLPPPPHFRTDLMPKRCNNGYNWHALLNRMCESQRELERERQAYTHA